MHVITLKAWLTARRDNTYRIARLKETPDKEEWLEDGRYFENALQVLDALESAQRHLSHQLVDPRWRDMHPINDCPVLNEVNAALAKAKG